MVCSAWDSEMKMVGSWFDVPGANETGGCGASSDCGVCPTSVVSQTLTTWALASAPLAAQRHSAAKAEDTLPDSMTGLSFHRNAWRWDRRSGFVVCQGVVLGAALTDHEKRWSVLPAPGAPNPASARRSRCARCERGCRRAVLRAD